MSEENVIEDLYQEEVYRLPARTVIVIPVSWNAITEQEVNLLTKILSAVKLSLAGVHIVVARIVSLEQIRSMNPKQLLIFGAEVEPDIAPYQNTVVNDIPIVRSHALSELDDARKKSLWVALKEMFAG